MNEELQQKWNKTNEELQAHEMKEQRLQFTIDELNSKLNANEEVLVEEKVNYNSLSILNTQLQE